MAQPTLIIPVRRRSTFFLPNGSEFALTLLAVAVALALTGAGEFSLDGLRARRRLFAQPTG